MMAYGSHPSQSNSCELAFNCAIRSSVYFGSGDHHDVLLGRAVRDSGVYELVYPEFRKLLVYGRDGLRLV